MQDCVVMAFRKRLRFRGYSDISICIARDNDDKRMLDKYVVQAVEPLAGVLISALYSKEKMHNSFR